MGDAADPRFSDPEKSIMQLHVNRGHFSAQQWNRELADSDWRTVGLFSFTNQAPQRFDVCRASDLAPHLLIAGTSTVPSFNENFAFF